MFQEYLSSKIVGECIAHFRKRKNISQEVLSGLADIGRTHLSAIERGERKPTLETLYRISCALGIKMSDILLDREATQRAPKRRLVPKNSPYVLKAG